jgi:hypothetical protein
LFSRMPIRNTTMSPSYAAVVRPLRISAIARSFG